MRHFAVIALAILLSACASQTPAGTPNRKTVIDAKGTYQPSIDNDGVYLVSLSIIDIQMGKYRTGGGTKCYWARLRSTDPNDIIESNRSNGPQEVVIRASDVAFLTRNCGTWQMTGLS